MIPVPSWLTGLSIKAVIYLAFGACFFLIGMGVHKTFSDRTIARMERDAALKESSLQADKAEAERNARETESHWRSVVAARENEWVEATRQRDSVIRDFAVADGRLRGTIERLRAANQASANDSPACRNFSQRVETLAVLLDERNGMATESERVADDLRDELALCRGYAKVMSH